MEQRARTGREIPGLQVMRAAAAIAVVLHHALEQSNGAARPFSPDWLTTGGAAGVDLFFVVSGFIMLHVSVPAGRPAVAPGRFLVQRASRIYPFYWACLLVVLAMRGAGLLRNHAWSATDLTLSALLLPLENRVIDIAWTLNYEVYFYAVFALGLTLGAPLATLGVTILVISGLLLLAPALPAGTAASFLADPIVLEFCLGLLLAAFWRAAAARGGRWLPAWPMLPAAIAVFAAPAFIAHAGTAGLWGLPRLLAWGLPAAVMVACALALPGPRGRLGRALIAIGDASYALYLVHFFVMILYGKLVRDTALGALPQAPVVLGAVILSILAGLLAHRVVETPLIRLARRLPGRRPAATPATVA